MSQKRNVKTRTPLPEVAVLVMGLLPAVLGGCSTPADKADLAGAGQTMSPPLGQVGAALSGDCRLATVGLPCDPDGDTGSATECEGLCWVDDDANVSCRALPDVGLTAIDLNGRICGDTQGLDCSHSCENGECVDKNARLGAACRPTARSSSCDGTCTLISGEPVCDAVETCTDVAISSDGCTLRACNFETNTESACVNIELDNATCTESMATPPPAAADAGSDAGSGAADSGTDAAAEEPEPVERLDAAVTGTGADASAPDEAPATPSETDTGVDAGPAPRRRVASQVAGGACAYASTAGGRAYGWGLVACALGLAGCFRRRRV